MFFVAVAMLFVSAPTNGDFWWSDAPRHAMDGVFYLDMFKEMPLDHLREYAISYYLQYPALTILFYPPVFALIEAIFFQLFGVSHQSAQLAVAAMTFGAATGAYRILRRWQSPVWACTTVVLFLGMPEVALWGRQVMLELPACAFLFWGVHVWLGYVDQDRPPLLFGSLVLIIAGIYTKQTVVFAIPLMMWMLWRARGWAMFRSKALWAGMLVFVAAIMPWALVTIRYGQVNFDSLSGGSWTAHPVFSWSSWTFYGLQWPAQMGWPLVLVALLFAAGAAIYKQWRNEGYAFWMAWLFSGYVFFSLIALKEPRHTVLILLPFAYLSVEAVRHLVPGRAAAVTGVLLTGLAFGQTVYQVPVPYVGGYRAAAEYVASHAPRNSTIAFSGHRDGSFIFNVRALEGRRDLAVVRADKLLLRVTQRRELGVVELGLSEEEILQSLGRLGVSYIVNEPRFWDDLGTMKRFQHVLARSQFERIATIPVAANTGHSDNQLEIYRNRAVVATGSIPMRIELPIIGTVIEGTLGNAARRK